MFQKDKCVAALHEELINPPHGFLSLDGFLFLLSCLLIMSSTSCCSPITLSCLSWGFNCLFQLFFPCLFSSSRLFLHADVFSKWQGRLSSSTHSFIKQVCYIFSAFSPLWDTLWWKKKQEGYGGKGRVRGPRKAENDLPKSQRWKKTKQLWHDRKDLQKLSKHLTHKRQIHIPGLLSHNGNSSVLHINTKVCGHVIGRISVCSKMERARRKFPVDGWELYAKMNRDCLSDRLTGYWEYSVTARTVCLCLCVSACFSAGLLSLCGSLCICVFFVFSFPCVFGFGLRQLLVVILFSHPPTQRATVLVRFSVGETALCLPLLLYRHCRINFS